MEDNAHLIGGVILTEGIIQPDYEEVLLKYKRTKNRFVNVMEDKECLLKHKFFELKTQYILKIGCLEHELYDLDIKLGAAKRKIELAEEALSQNNKVNLSLINAEIKREFREFLDIINSKEKEIRIASYFNSIDKLTEEEYQDLRKYYKNIARLILPDINPNLNEIQRELWEKASVAYENGEVQFLKIIYKLANDEAFGLKEFENIPLSEIDRRIIDLESKINNDLRDIQALQANFPFNKEDLLKDEDKIKEIQDNLRSNINDGNTILKLMEEHFLMLLDDTRFLS